MLRHSSGFFGSSPTGTGRLLPLATAAAPGAGNPPTQREGMLDLLPFAFAAEAR
ncbi:Hypothetical protein A7982_11087 [Minicystis rosea]|nr:Hypothetical protein A7982_11087 [Minicystis rosea]